MGERRGTGVGNDLLLCNKALKEKRKGVGGEGKKRAAGGQKTKQTLPKLPARGPQVSRGLMMWGKKAPAALGMLWELGKALCKVGMSCPTAAVLHFLSSANHSLDSTMLGQPLPGGLGCCSVP